jgi:flagellar export protein FliJ
MPRFRCRLQTVLLMREAQCALRRAELAASLAELRTLDQRRMGVEQELAGAQSFSRDRAQPGRIDIGRWHSAQRYEAALRAELKSIAQRGQALAVEIDRRQQVVAAAEREVDVLEKLRDRQAGEFRQHEARAETRQFDEVAAHNARRAGPD